MNSLGNKEFPRDKGIKVKIGGGEVDMRARLKKVYGKKRKLSKTASDSN